ncbi:MAG: hypothetical protein ABEJ40_05205 [Haloarculaceae archaeon]
MNTYATPPAFDPSEAETLMEPPEGERGNWTGAPCVHEHGGETYLAVRERTPDERGRAITVHRRVEETAYDRIARLTADELGVVSVERPALGTDPHTGDAKLYLPVDRGSNEWTIRKLDDAPAPDAFDPSTGRDVLRPAAGGSDRATVKDPCLTVVGGRYYMFYAGHDGRSEQAHLATSVDGETWTRHPDNPVLERGYWHDHHTRVSCVVPAPDAPAWLVFYDGSGLTDEGMTWNLRTGVGVSPDCERVVDASPDGPRYAAPTAPGTGVDTFATCRYLDVLPRGDAWEVFAEVAREDGAFELRYQRVPRPGTGASDGDARDRN